MFKINRDINKKSNVINNEQGMFMFVAKAEEPEHVRKRKQNYILKFKN